MNRWFLVFAVLALGCSDPPSGPGPSPEVPPEPPPVAPPPPTLNLAGTVTQPDGEPAAGFIVHRWACEQHSSASTVSDCKGIVTNSTATGEFSFQGDRVAGCQAGQPVDDQIIAIWEPAGDVYWFASVRPTCTSTAQPLSVHLCSTSMHSMTWGRNVLEHHLEANWCTDRPPPGFQGPPPAEPEYLAFTVLDPPGDNTGKTDVDVMRFAFDRVDGTYRIRITANAAGPFRDSLRVNIHLLNTTFGAEQSGAGFSDAVNDSLFAQPSTELILEGVDPRLTQWAEGDRVHTNSLNGTPNPPGTTLYRSAVNHYPMGFLTNEDVIAFSDLARPAVLERATGLD